MIRTFVETGIFKRLLDSIGDSGLEKCIKDDILENPSCGAIISGTGGVRKFRVANAARGKGKRGGYRVLFLDLPKREVTYLMFIYDKDDLENISSEQKKSLKKIVERIKDE